MSFYTKLDAHTTSGAIQYDESRHLEFSLKKVISKKQYQVIQYIVCCVSEKGVASWGLYVDIAPHV